MFPLAILFISEMSIVKSSYLSKDASNLNMNFFVTDV
jgi:hypothetical protein